MSDEPLEERTDLILNPDGPNIQATREVVKAISVAQDDEVAGSYVRNLIERLKSGYELQSGQKYKE